MMDIDALKVAVVSLDREKGEIVLAGDIAAREAQRGLATVANRQIVQVGAGIAVAIAGGTVWGEETARHALLFAGGLIVNLYGAVMIALGVAGLAHASRIDMAAPVAETEERTARLRRIMLATGWLLGANWWVLWLPFAAVAVRLVFGADMFAPARIGAWLAAAVLSGVAGWIGMWLLRRWAIESGRASLAARLDDLMTGRSFQAARRRVDEASRFSAA